MTPIHDAIPRLGPRPEGARMLAGSAHVWFDSVLQNGNAVPASALAPGALERLSAARPSLLGLTLDRPRIMGILNITPDSFSDGGEVATVAAAVARAQAMGPFADILDVGGESTRPGAETVPEAEEVARVVPVISAIRAAGIATPISIDTRKSRVAEAALDAGADMLNDVSAMTFDPDMAPLVAEREVPVCLMHAQGDPKTMQTAPSYSEPAGEVAAYLREAIMRAEAAGIPRVRIIADPGIGFGKTAAHNLSILARLSVYHELGVPLLLGASRKRFIGTIGKAEKAKDRMPGSIAVALHGAAQGVHVIRVHDVAETWQALRLWTVLNGDECDA